MNYYYEVYDYVEAAKRRNRLNPAERNKNTDINPDDEEVVMITKDTAYIDDEGNIVNETITRPLSSEWDFLNSYIINIYPDTTCWVNDFPRANNEQYMQMYFSHPAYNDYPHSGRKLGAGPTPSACGAPTTCWPVCADRHATYNATACPPRPNGSLPHAAWRTTTSPGKARTPRTRTAATVPTTSPAKATTRWNGTLITNRVGSYSPNSNGLYDMAGNVAEWTSDAYTEGGVTLGNDLNPEVLYKATREDPYGLKKKGGKGRLVEGRERLHPLRCPHVGLTKTSNTPTSASAACAR